MSKIMSDLFVPGENNQDLAKIEQFKKCSLPYCYQIIGIYVYI